MMCLMCSRVLRSLVLHVPHVPGSLRSLVPYGPPCALRAVVLTCLVPYVVPCSTCITSYMLLCPTYLMSYVPSTPTCLVLCVHLCITCLVSYMPCAQCTLALYESFLLTYPQWLEPFVLYVLISPFVIWASHGSRCFFFCSFPSFEKIY